MSHPFLPNDDNTRKEMLKAIGLETIEELFSCCIPENVMFRGELDLPQPMSELEAMRHLQNLAAKNKPASTYVSFLGGGVSDHYIPAVIDHIVKRGEFYTAYTPYQPEVSQGTLQNIFEFQSMICMMTKMDVANASMYDGASAMAEAAVMVSSATRLKKVLISKSVNPEYLEAVKTYAWAKNIEIVEVPIKEGKTDLDALTELMDNKAAGLLMQHPNYFGQLEDVEAIEKLVHAQPKGLLVVSVDPLSLGILKAPGDYNADIVSGEGQPLGNPISYGGPHLGFLACKDKLMRKLPGRIIGITEDVEGARGFVMSMQAREQHIRRHRATSNICTNQALNALAASVYLSLMGKEGLAEVANQCLQKTEYLKGQIKKIPGYEIAFSGATFKEFVVKSEYPWEKIQAKLLENDILAGIPLKWFYPELENHFLVCVTEKRQKEDMDALVRGLEAVK